MKRFTLAAAAAFALASCGETETADVAEAQPQARADTAQTDDSFATRAAQLRLAFQDVDRETFGRLFSEFESIYIERTGAFNKADGEAFLADNKTKEGVLVTDSGLQYTVVDAGTQDGAQPSAEDMVQVHYRGMLINGAEFDSSYARGMPAEFPLNGVIKGWTEGLQLMKEGAKYTFFIPSELAYGENAPPSIGPNQTLVFDVELLKVVSDETPADDAASAEGALEE
ncbi:MAG: FKBP-type peptidyl-prolyl cis-trans isomerase [Pseudomonadota bacterium]